MATPNQPDGTGIRALYQQYRTTRARVELSDAEVLKRLFAEIDLPGASRGNTESNAQLLAALAVRDLLGGRVIRFTPTDLPRDEIRRRGIKSARETGEPALYGNVAPELPFLHIAVPHEMQPRFHHIKELKIPGAPPEVEAAYLALRRRVVAILRREAQPN